MREVKTNNLLRLATEFRAAILNCDPKKLPVTLQNFPKGSCGDASLLLAKYLQENGHSNFNYVLGMRDKCSHAWIQRADLIVDITADQFDDQQSPVIVTEDQSWHKSFEPEVQHIADFHIYDSHTVSFLQNAYNRIKKQIN